MFLKVEQGKCKDIALEEKDADNGLYPHTKTCSTCASRIYMVDDLTEKNTQYLGEIEELKEILMLEKVSPLLMA